MKSIARAIFLASVAATPLIVPIAAPLCAQTASKNYSIPAQDLGDALREFAVQSGQDVVFNPALTAGKRSNAVRGTIDANQALRVLLNGSGLSYTTTSTGFAVRSAVGNAPIDANSASSKGEAAVVPKRNEVANYAGVPEITIIGKRTINADIRRTRDDPQPYVTFDREVVKQSNADNLDQFFRTRLPMNDTQASFAQSSGNLGGNRSQVDLRGLGPSQTLILLDGRRLPTSGINGLVFQPDLNAIPLTAVERIEVLPSTASGIYGGGATGGVVNVITRKDFIGVDLNATYSNTFRADAADYRIDGTAGFEFQGGRTHVLISGSYSKTDDLLVGDRDFLTRARALEFSNNSSAFFNLSPPPVGFTTNIMSQDGSNLVLKNGTALNSPRTSVPLGYAGPGSDQGAALVTGAGGYNLAIPNDLQGNQQSLLSGPERASAMLNLRHKFADHIEAFAEASWTDNRSHTFFEPPISSTTLSATAPDNPFTVPIIVSFPVTGLPRSALQSDTQTFRAVGGVIVRLPRNWTAEADYSWNRTRLFVSGDVTPIGDPDGSGPGISADTALSNGSLNVLRDLNAFPIDWSPFLLPSPTLVDGPVLTSLNDATFHLSGPVVDLPGGALTLSGLAEWRREASDGLFSDTTSVNGVHSTQLFPSRSQTVMSFYAEARAPLVSPNSALPLVRELELQASVRYDDYETKAPSPNSATASSHLGPFPTFTDKRNHVAATKVTLGVRYEPVEDLALRASYGTGFLPPSIFQIVPGSVLGPFAVPLADPKRGGVSALAGPFTFVTGGNPNLTSENSTSWSVGGVFTPRFVPGLRISLDYTDIKKSNEILSLTFATALANEDALPGRITRLPLTAADSAKGFTGGVINAFDLTSVNAASTHVQAYDLQANYSWHPEGLGEFQFYALATWEPHFKRHLLPSAPVLDSAGFNTGPLKWRGNGGFTWSNGPWALGWNIQYYDSYFLYTAGSAPALIADTILNQGAAKVPSEIYNDLFIAYRFDRSSAFAGGALRGTEVNFGIQNVFDKEPPIIAGTGLAGGTFAQSGYSPYGDPRLRRFTLTVRKSF
jgi:iron complex outermembrane recepter protein